MPNKRLQLDTVMEAPEFAVINNKTYSPKRFKVYEVNALMNEKKSRVLKIQALQRKAMTLQTRAQEFANVEEVSEELLGLVTQAHELEAELLTMTGDAEPYWILEHAYPDAFENGDLEQIDFEELDPALEMVFKVNPSLGKYKQMLLKNPLNPNG